MPFVKTSSRHALSGVAIGMLLSAAAAAAPDPLAEPAPAMGLPKIVDVTIDGGTDDWADRGAGYDALAEAVPERRPYAAHDATARLAWDEAGLLVRLDVVDDAFAESDNDNALWERDGVELFVANAHGTRRVQFIFTPGLDPAHRQPRVQAVDHRPADARTPALAQASAVAKVDGGYVLEARIPWAQLNVVPTAGLEVRVQAQVNDVDAGARRRQLRLQPTGGVSADPSQMPRFRLIDGPAESSVSVAASGAYERFRHARVNVGASASLAGKGVAVRDGGRVVAAGTLAPQGRLAVASLLLPMPRVNYGPLDVLIDGQPAATVVLPDLQASRATAIENLDVRFSPFVFGTAQFPQVDFDQPGLAEDLLGPYTIETAYYDAQFNPVTSADRPGRYGAVVSVVPDDGPTIKRFVTLFRSPAPVKWHRDDLVATVELPEAFGIDPVVNRERSRHVADYLKGALRRETGRSGHAAILLAGLHDAKPGTPALLRTGPEAMDEAYWHELKARTGQQVPYRYAITLPPNYEASPDARWPLILFLHGSGERGHDLEQVLVHGPAKEAKAGRAMPFVIVSPQCPPRQSWNVRLLRGLLDEVKAKYRVDPDRVHLTGLSMGGYGSWSLAIAHPDEFAALVPICGGGDPLDAARLRDLPTWIVHGAKDEAVYPIDSYRMVDALRQVGGRVRFTLYPDAGHDSWTATYANPQLYDWMLQQRRGHPQQPRATTAGTQPSE